VSGYTADLVLPWTAPQASYCEYGVVSFAWATPQLKSIDGEFTKSWGTPAPLRTGRIGAWVGVPSEPTVANTGFEINESVSASSFEFPVQPKPGVA
jgi:hypothetical protein